MKRNGRWFRRGAAAVAVTLAAGACGSGSGHSTATTPSGPSAAGGGSPTASGAMFGTLASPCGPGSAKGNSDRGVTDTAIRIGYGDDRGFTGSPGLDQELGDSVKAMIKWCNDQGGILGRKIQGDFYDAAITQVNTVTQQACQSDFMLVGEGFGLDEAAEGTRLGCNLVAVPAFTAGVDVANAPEMYQALPNPVDYVPASGFFQVAKLFPDAVKAYDFMHTNLAAASEVNYTKNRNGATAAGWKQLNCGVTLNYNGEANYQPFAQKFVACGAKLVYTVLPAGPVLYGMLQADNQAGLKPIYATDAADYSAALAEWNTAGLADQLYVRVAYAPLEESSQIPAVAAYLNAVKAVGGKTGGLGEQAASSFLLWATAAKACGSGLTRQCMVNQLSAVHSWTGGGLNAPSDPGANMPPDCGMLLKLSGTKWTQSYPATVAQFDCSKDYVVKVDQADWGTTLNSQRQATKFLSPNVIAPKS